MKPALAQKPAPAQADDNGVMPNPGGANAYLKTKVMTASPLELRQMLIDGAIRFAETARDGLQKKDFEALYTGVTRCQAILMELINALDARRSPDLCRQLAALYTYMYTRLMRASTERSLPLLDEVLNLLRYERETWDMAQAKLIEENTAASRLSDTPHAAPPNDPALQPRPTSLVGASVSLRG
jgi:flagellar protein FliS